MVGLEVFYTEEPQRHCCQAAAGKARQDARTSHPDECVPGRLATRNRTGRDSSGYRLIEQLEKLADVAGVHDVPESTNTQVFCGHLARAACLELEADPGPFSKPGVAGLLDRPDVHEYVDLPSSGLMKS